MELYRKFPKFCAGWCFLEIFIFAGQLFGWTSIQYVLKKEGFYSDLCKFDNGAYKKCVSEFINPDDVSSAQIEIFVTKGCDSRYLISRRNKTDLNTDSAGDFNFISQSVMNQTKGQYAFELSTNGNDYASQSGEDNSDVVIQSDQWETGEGDRPTCYDQDARLNLWFSVAICISYVACSVMGPVLNRIGMRLFRLVLICMYIVGVLCIGFAPKEIPWLIAPGLCCMGVAGMGLYATNIHISYLFPAVQSTITSVFVGLYDVSTVFSFLLKVCHESGISRRYYCLGLAVVHLILVGISTCFLLPSNKLRLRSTDHAVARKEKPSVATYDKVPGPDGNCISEKEKFLNVGLDQDNDADGRKVRALRSLCSIEYLLHVFWMCCQGLRFVTFLGFFSAWTGTKFRGNSIKESYYLGVFSYVTMGTAITAVTAGMLHDCQRRQYMSRPDFQRRRLPIVLPLAVTSLLSIIITSLIFVQQEIFINIVFVVFTIYRSFLFSFEITFLNDVYPLQTFPVLFGVLHSSAGLAGLLQYPLFEWYKSSQLAPDQVNYFLIGLAVASFIHPLYIWISCRRHGDQGGKSDAIELFI
ncbi:equilibrative nucleobase transporter 1-like [Mya arenaria]|uniref:equilibrative nucleobase transporter 1-like n=1 Tax=Mya arenaria TaxID=6604 RepID=UPI0022E86D5C|nr:equilibrative nucleobase transporter 1-like [Mya arenaria]